MEKYIEPLKTATTNVIEMMAFEKPLSGKPFQKKDKIARGDVSGIIALNGLKNGVLVLSFSAGAACKVVNGMLGESHQAINDDIKDGVGELTNMIAGNLRKNLASTGVILEAGIPSVVVGKGHEISLLVEGSCISLPFKIDDFFFAVDISFET